MEILAVGNVENLNECKAKFGEAHEYHFAGNHSDAKILLNENKIVFDFILDKTPEQISIYKKGNNQCVFLNTVNTTLVQLAGKSEATVFGFCGLPTFLNREILEVSTVDTQSKEKLETTCSQLNIKFKIVEDRVGMITPRIICMIINEAYFAIEEEVASRTDIDLAMKLGTNYPFGPFEWSKKIGIRNVYELLKAVHENAQDDRYKICALLEKEALS